MTVNTINQLSEGTGPRQNMHRGERLITLLRGELKVLGAIQILIGLVHFGFGSILTCLYDVNISYIIASAYVYWGGVLATHFMPDGIITHQGELLPVDPPPSYEACARTGFANPGYSGQVE
ncbi:hypothetical protein JD844_022133 [Phrynosoma platyrhinos]|uniref:Uncharacterized protein n=1 Tax=Phrynosoma platyrhinos TaxID=52577 RepID=A0ABQ7SUJ0_PHRPL|nr:hypothetical protein JD844_022133 [Phrynosoma platyrhinos]